MASPTLWMRRSEERSCFLTFSSPNFIWALVAVGVV